MGHQPDAALMKVITVVSAKGGVGKTTLAANLASVLAARSRRVIVLDLDPQNALRLHFGIPLDSIDGISRATLAGDAWQSVMFDGVDGVTVLPYGAVLEDDRRRFEAHVDREPAWLAHSLDTLGLDPSDIVIVDTPPGSSVYTRTALTAANFALNVVLADAASYAAIPQMERMIENYASPRADFGGQGYVVNQVDQSRQLSKDVLKVLRNMLGTKLFPGVIHQDEGVSESLACDTTLIHYDPLSQAAADLRACGDWLLSAIDTMRVSPRNVA
jgi:cellulose synthase operon protein YhjQ